MEKGSAATPETVERLRATVRANPRSTAFVPLAHALCDLGRAAEAEDISRRGLAEHPGLPTGEVALARALTERGKLREAQAVLLRTVQVNPQHPDAYRWLGEVLVRRGDLDRARPVLEHAAALAPHDERTVELIREAGGEPPESAARPRSDFEATRIADSEAIARRLEKAQHGLADEATVIRPMDDLIAEAQPTVMRAMPEGPYGARPPTPPGLDISDEQMDSGMREILALLPKATMNAGATTDAVSAGAALDAAMRRRRSTTGGVASSVPVRSRTGRIVVVAVVAALALVAVVQVAASLKARERDRGLVAEMAAATAAGSLPRLLRAREVGLGLLAARRDDAAVAADVAFVSALLAREYALASDAEAEAHAARAEMAPDGTPARAAALSAARALLALGTGDVAAAQERAVRAVALGKDDPRAAYALARVRALSGELEAARAALDGTLARHPEFAPAAVLLGEILLDAGEADLAASTLRKVIVKTPGSTRARLLLAEAERAKVGAAAPAAPGAGDEAALDAGCRADGRMSPAIAAACALGRAERAWLTGDRERALSEAHVARAAAPPEPRVLARTSQLLAQLGDIDAAADMAERAGRYATDRMPALAWARLGVTLGRGAAGEEPAAPAAGPEERLFAARHADASGGPAALSTRLAEMPQAALARERELAALATFAARPVTAPEGTPPPPPSLPPGPASEFLLGRIARQEHRLEDAAAALSRALDGHGDVCRAGVEYGAVLAALGRDAAGEARRFETRHPGCAVRWGEAVPAAAADEGRAGRAGR